nr:immunoglobulin light chain junction region [Macaca mulatta]MOW15465.1 immunoglobulin light chain junction region [Macaca mulatta]MOW16783.1 immunoglobulin light chain junction region [Macaca mulatta]MOW18292.1 immunoglobulin light chain junction region [Macaca mulatta]MOW18301.1 immunoglobulin light chain junction region [Macaca mulatta]
DYYCYSGYDNNGLF